MIGSGPELCICAPQIGGFIRAFWLPKVLVLELVLELELVLVVVQAVGVQNAAN